jgi:hypothetical protein
MFLKGIVRGAVGLVRVADPSASEHQISASFSPTIERIIYPIGRGGGEINCQH